MSQGQPRSAQSSDSLNRAAEIAQIVDQARALGFSTGQPDFTAQIAAHPHLMPELGDELQKLKRIMLAKASARMTAETGRESPGQESPYDEAPARLLEDVLRGPEVPLSEGPGTRIGRYKLLQLIGEGGFGSVFMAEQVAPVTRKVAIKIIKLGMDTRTVIARFEAERQALAIMDHPNIARVLDAGSTESGRPYFVMELVKGEPIGEHADRNHLTIPERLELFLQVCQAVQHAHQKGVIHRDLKPSNVLVTTQDGKPFAKVIDFGIAKAMSARLTEKTLFTEFRQLIGTPAYMSPEQADGSLDVDTRSDVYSLGVLLYELLTGTAPFESEKLRSAGYDEMLRIIREVDPPRPSTRLTVNNIALVSVAALRRTEPRRLGSLVRGELDWIVMRALDKDRRRRYTSASDLAADVERHLNGDPIVAAPDSIPYRARKFARRYRGPVMAVSAVALALILGVAASVWQAVRATRAEISAVNDRNLAEDARQHERQQRQAADAARQEADHQSLLARHAALVTDARSLLQQRLLPAAYERASAACSLLGTWEDGLLFDQIATQARRNWRIISRISLDKPAVAACIIQDGNSHLVAVATAQTVDLYDIQTAQRIRSVPSPHEITSLVAPGNGRCIVALGGEMISRFEVPSLSRSRTRQLPNRIGARSISEGALLLIQIDGVCRTIDWNTLDDQASISWSEAPRGAPLPVCGTISPSGKRAVLHGGYWNDPIYLWDTTRKSVTAIKPALGVSHLAMASENELEIAFLPDIYGGFPARVLGVYLPWAAPSLSSLLHSSPLSFPTVDVKRSTDWQVWKSGLENQGMLVGDAGCVFGSLVPAGTRVSERFANIAPGEHMPPVFLADSISQPGSWWGKLMVLGQGNEILITRSAEAPTDLNYYDLVDFSATLTSAGLLRFGTWQFTLEPLNPADPIRYFREQDPSDGKWFPWSICADPAGNDVVIICQLSLHDQDFVMADYGGVWALVYHVGGLANAPSRWPLEKMIKMGDRPSFSWASRISALDPSGSVLAYWADPNRVLRFDLATGRPLDSLDLEAPVNRSDDGSRLAGFNPVGNSADVYDVKSGQRVASVPLAGEVQSLCFSQDSSKLILSTGSDIEVIDIASGTILRDLKSSLLPTAWHDGVNRFAAIQPDESSSSSGNIVVADTADGAVTTVLIHAASNFCPAAFSASGRELAVVSQRWLAELNRSITPAEFLTIVQRDAREPVLPTEVRPQFRLSKPLPTAQPDPVFLSATEGEKLVENIGHRLCVTGRPRALVWNASHSHARLIFDGDTAHPFSLRIAESEIYLMQLKYGQDWLAPFIGHTIRLTGWLDADRARGQITPTGTRLSLPDTVKIEFVPDSPPGL